MSGNVLEEALEAEKIIIYGAHLVALECARWFIAHGKKDSILGFAVTEIDGNPNELLGFPVKQIERYKTINARQLVIIAMPEKYHNTAEEYGRRIGFGRFIRISLETMSKIKGLGLLAEQVNYPQLPFTLKEDRRDVSWLDMTEPGYISAGSESKPCLRDFEDCREGDGIDRERHYKFPTLFYLEKKEVFAEASGLDFCKDYEEVCGKYRNLHRLPVKTVLEEEKGITDILCVYAVFSEWDSAKVEARQYAPWICPVQIGSGLTDRRYGKMSDDTGENISDKNRIFAELTGSYWIWKNRQDSEYKGLCHYRRHFVISQEEIMALADNLVDILLTTPRYVPGGIKNMFLAETPVKEEVYQSMVSAIEELSPDDKMDFEQYMDSVFYYPNNMVIAKNEVYDGYCAWMFPILFRMLEADRKRNYGHETDRHIAYAAELLTSYYFVKNRDRYSIAVTDYQLLF